MRLFVISVVGYESYGAWYVRSPRDMSESRFDSLVDSIKDKEWRALVRDSKVTHASENTLVEKIVETLVSQYSFTRVELPEYSITEYSYQKHIKGSTIEVKTNGKEEVIVKL